MQQNGLQNHVTIDRARRRVTAWRKTRSMPCLYECVRQRTVSTIYNPYNQYFVVMEWRRNTGSSRRTSTAFSSAPAAGNVTGTQQTRCPAGTVSGVKPFAAVAPGWRRPTPNALNANAQANLTTNAISNSRGGTSSGSADSTAAETMVPLSPWPRAVNNHTAIQVNHQSA